MKSIVRAIVPKSAYERIARIKALIGLGKWISPDRMRYITQVVKALEGRFDRECPVCGYQGKFLGKGMPVRIDAWCPSCKSVGKHRLMWNVWNSHEDINRPQNVLHFAPEPCLRKWLQERLDDYVTADYLRTEKVDRKLNVESLDLEDGSYDVIILNHVLEHVDDKKALAELYRVTANGGRVFVTIPIIEGLAETYENSDVRSEEDREMHFGQYDHLRVFGADFRQRAEAAGFRVKEYTASGAEGARYSLVMGEKVFVLNKDGKTTAS
jgi:SAM-dependent methyltransferase